MRRLLRRLADGALRLLPLDAIGRRWLAQRDAARHSGDVLARAVQSHLRGSGIDLVEELRAYGERNGPEWALRPARGSS